jgi:putative glutamine amidotransferase
MRHSQRAPRIIVTVRRAPRGAEAAATGRLAASARYYTEAVRQAGGEAVLVGAGDPVPDAYDGLLLAGGADIHPRHYRQEVVESVRATLTMDPDRDILELALASQALEADHPTLCICRGVQVINVAAGGTLWQDLSLAGISPAAHNQDGRMEPWEAAHRVRIEPGSHLAGILGDVEIGVNTFHHQAVADPGAGLAVTARAPDGTVEGMESLGHRFVVGVQWHPERMVSHHPAQRRLFERLVEASRRS